MVEPFLPKVDLPHEHKVCGGVFIACCVMQAQ